MRKTIETSIEINASPEKVWSILADANAYHEWNPFIKSVSGAFKEGEKIKVIINPPGGGTFAFQPLVLSSKFPEIRWRGKVLIKGIFDGEHYFRIESVSEQKTRFIHGENFSGLLVRALGGTLKKSETGFQLMNEALKKRAED